MRNKKELTKDQIIEIHAQLDTATEAMARVWETSMCGLKLNGPEYKRICKTAKQVQSLKYAYALNLDKKDGHIYGTTTYGFN